MGIAAAVIGIGSAVAGTAVSLSASQKAAAAQQQQIAAQQAIQAQQKKASDLQFQRSTLETLRNQQISRSIALSNAVNQGANFGSSLQGGYGQISGEVNTNLLSLYQNKQIGNAIYNDTQTLDQAMLQYSQAQSQQALGSGLMQFGSSMLNAQKAFGNLTQGFNPFAPAQPLSLSAGLYAGPSYGFSLGTIGGTTGGLGKIY